ncbi:hypothetical protein HKD28_15070 [Gluconobacter sp. LMG 1744]|uniref:hypothetical protein n=1 Tax=Gluconobacter cadivus TaxID=2728101 RepID=UPI0018853AE4|nr:hypothetical protein [Gluconobacter cadivus]MBF0892712.1 hypothetical protein [Gluconobacter cadivus]
MDIIVPTLRLDQDDLKAALKECGKVFVMEARLLLNQGGSDIPHTETGLLERKLKWTVRTRGSVLTLVAKADVRYATALFMGSKRGGHVVKPRPLFDVAMERCEPRFKEIIAKHLNITIE